MLEQKTRRTSTTIAVVVPCYRVEKHIAEVIRGIPDFVSVIVTVDDASPDGSSRAIEQLHDPRVILLRHQTNQGVGGAMLTGYRECLRIGVDIIVKMDGDGQMDPAQLPRLIAPLLRGEADYTKGNRWNDAISLTRMPLIRRFGNLGLSFLSKLASGQWKAFDPCNGYTAIRADVLRDLCLEAVAKDYYFEISLLVELGIARATVCDVPMPAIYGEEKSSLKVSRILWTFPRRLFRSTLRRAWQQFFIRDFGPIALCLVFGSLLVSWSFGFGAYSWWQSGYTGVPATAGTVMIAAMPFLMGFQLLLQALVMDVSNTPNRALSSGRTLSEVLEIDARPEVKKAA